MYIDIYIRFKNGTSQSYLNTTDINDGILDKNHRQLSFNHKQRKIVLCINMKQILSIEQIKHE